ncbi:MAG: hypothetical protein NTY30_01170 [Candidatus Berkelbacteria bacterium]|nr:hypothetical protein [Candidatus Berkelbacteria bacterium]
MDDDGNPAVIPHTQTEEQIIESMTKLRDAGAIGYTNGDEMTDERIIADAKMMVKEFSYYKERSIRMNGGDNRVISRYNSPGHACTPRKFNVYRVSGDDTTHTTLTAALKAVGFDLNQLE